MIPHLPPLCSFPTTDNRTELNTKVYRTDQLGTIILTSNGNDIKIENIKTDTNNE